ncbi:MAG: hypothetical protein K2L86_08850 [Lachnospiraceae bacterium]|nr:hypothetical protein [Lachnospiraceae bacterium]
MQRIMALILSVVLLNQSVSVLEEISPTETGAEENTNRSENVNITETLQESDTANIEISQETAEAVNSPQISDKELISQETSELVSQPETGSEGTIGQPETSDEEITESTGENEEESDENTTELTRESDENTIESTKESDENTTESTRESDENTTELTKENDEEIVNEVVDDNTETITDIDTGSTALSEENQEESTEVTEAAPIFNVSLPASTNAYLDPGNLSGKGQIFSEQYIVENYGNTDAAIKIKNIEIHCSSIESQYEFSEDAITEDYSTVKKLNVELVWKNETEHTEKVLKVIEGSPDEEVLLLKAAEYDENNEFAALNPGSTGMFYFTGTMNANTNIEWEDGDIIVSFDYEIVCAEEAHTLEQTEDTEEDTGTNTEEEQETQTKDIDSNTEEQETCAKDTDMNTEEEQETQTEDRNMENATESKEEQETQTEDRNMENATESKEEQETHTENTENMIETDRVSQE